MQCNVDEQDIPIPDKSCDFVVASHIAEHIHDPEHLCSEMERIGKAGYIETPGMMGELMQNYPHHLWWVTKVSDKIIFIKKPAFFTGRSWKVPCMFPFSILYYLFRNTCYRWDGNIKRVVI